MDGGRIVIWYVVAILACIEALFWGFAIWWLRAFPATPLFYPADFKRVQSYRPPMRWLDDDLHVGSASLAASATTSIPVRAQSATVYPQ